MSEAAISPKYRFLLRARISEVGFKTIKEFSATIGAEPSRVSRVIGGWEFPSANLARSMADALRVSTEELKRIL